MTARRGRRAGGGGVLRVLLVFVLGAGAGIAAWVFLPRLVDRSSFLPEGRPKVVEVTPVPTPGRPRPTRAPVATPRPTPAPSARPVEPPPPADFEAAGGPGGGALALVIDDVGHSDEALARLARLKGPLALAVLPGAPRAAEAAALARARGWDLLVHLPMEPSGGGGEPAAIGAGDDGDAIARKVEDALARLPGAIGLNNHQGSAATRDPRVMRAVLAVVKRHGLFFLDSRTSPSTVAAAEAHRVGVATLSRDVFLDAVRAEAPGRPVPPGAFSSAWAKALETAAARGRCVLIGHPAADTVAFLEARLPDLARRGILQVRVSELAE